jgi:hypothetical protein
MNGLGGVLFLLLCFVLPFGFVIWRWGEGGVFFRGDDYWEGRRDG